MWATTISPTPSPWLERPQPYDIVSRHAWNARRSTAAASNDLNLKLIA
jgi:hypothetical protein